MEAPIAFVEIATVTFAFITTGIAGIVACVTWLQFRIQRDDLKLALFERRATIYTSAKELIVDAITAGKSEKNKLLPSIGKSARVNFCLTKNYPSYSIKFSIRRLNSSI